MDWRKGGGGLASGVTPQPLRHPAVTAVAPWVAIVVLYVAVLVQPETTTQFNSCIQKCPSSNQLPISLLSNHGPWAIDHGPWANPSAGGPKARNGSLCTLMNNKGRALQTLERYFSWCLAETLNADQWVQGGGGGGGRGWRMADRRDLRSLKNGSACDGLDEGQHQRAQHTCSCRTNVRQFSKQREPPLAIPSPAVPQ